MCGSAAFWLFDCFFFGGRLIGFLQGYSYTRGSATDTNAHGLTERGGWLFMAYTIVDEIRTRTCVLYNTRYVLIVVFGRAWLLKRTHKHAGAPFVDDDEP